MKLRNLSLAEDHKNVVNSNAFVTSQEMNTLPVLFLICALQYMECGEELESKVIISTIPKKVQTPLQKSIKIINARKFNKLRKSESRKTNYKKKDKKNFYTAFPPIANKGIIDSTENSYFQGVHVADRKPRVKKVLPEYGLNVFRNKRSADINANKTIIKRRTSKRKRNHKNKNILRKNPEHATKSIDRKRDRNQTQKKGKSKLIKGDVTYVYKKHKNKTTQRLRHGNKRPKVSLRYTVNNQNTTKPQINKKSTIRTNKRTKNKRSTKKEERKVRNRRLIAGRDAMIREYPYVVSIQKGGEHWCAGALLNQRLVITTANCIWKAHRVSRMRVRAGSRHMDRGGQVAKIMEVAKHPAWSIRSGPDNDLGLLLLDRNIRFSDNVHGVDLPNRAMWPAFEDVWVTSWGSNRRDGVYDKIASTLQVYHAMLLDHDKCNNVTMRFGVPVSRNFICVTQTGRRAPCTRDTGAPAVSDGILWGVASWGIRKLCGTERFPAMFSYVASKSNLDFITNATHFLMSDKRYYPYADRFAIKDLVTTVSTTH